VKEFPVFKHEWKYLFLIIIIFIAACIETDIYLPAFTDMMTFFSVSEQQIQNLLTWNFIGICLSGPLYGPISDVVGRKKPLMIALGLFLIGSLMTLFTSTFNIMLLGRVLQGLGSGGCFTLGTAIIFDVFQEKKAMQAINKINSIVPFIMAAAPMVGGYLNHAYGFRANFFAITICVFLSLMICFACFDETLPEKNRIPFQPKKIFNDFKKVSLSLPFWQTTVIVSLVFAGYLAFLSYISVLFVLEFGVSKQMLPFHQAALLGSWLIANLTCKRSLDRWGIPTIKKSGTVLFVSGGIGLVITSWIAPENPYLFTGCMTLYAFGINWVQGLYFPEGMELFPDIKGITASFLTSIRLLLSAGIVGLGSLFYNSTIYPIVTIIFGIVAIILAIIILYERNRYQAPRISTQMFTPHA
jgi:MFS transporter, DHA1 family, multidrug resistance protein